MRINGKRKGNNYELHCCKLWKELWGSEFIRTPMSGGWNKQICSGDIICTDKNGKIDETFPFSIECKNSVEFDFNKMFEGKSIVFTDLPSRKSWWTQSFLDAKDAHKAPFLMFKGNGTYDMCAFETGLAFNHYTKGILSFGSLINQTPRFQFGSLHIMLWDYFVVNVGRLKHEC